MNNHCINTPKHLWRRGTPLLLCLVLLTLLLSACGNSAGKQTTGSNMPTSLPTPAVSPTLEKQGQTQLQTFQQWINLMQKYNGNTSTYQQQYSSDQQALQSAKNNATYQAALTTLNSHINDIQLPAMKAEGQSLQQQLQQQVTAFGQKHTYYNAYDKTTYQMGFEYGQNGIGSWVQDDLTSAKTIADYQQAIENLNMYITNFQAMAADTDDKTPYNQPHQTDIQLMKHYGMMDSKVVMVSVAEQAMRFYDHGQLIKAFLVTTGRPDKPSIPGTWWVEGKQSPTVFKASVPKSSPYWYPDTPINYAMQYHSDGYFIHDSWWRNDYGPHTQFPHADSSGDSFSSDGSHGCVNMSKDDAGWLYNHVEIYTHIVIY